MPRNYKSYGRFNENIYTRGVSIDFLIRWMRIMLSRLFYEYKGMGRCFVETLTNVFDINVDFSVK